MEYELNTLRKEASKGHRELNTQLELMYYKEWFKELKPNEYSQVINGIVNNYACGCSVTQCVYGTQLNLRDYLFKCGDVVGLTKVVHAQGYLTTLLEYQLVTGTYESLDSVKAKFKYDILTVA